MTSTHIRSLSKRCLRVPDFARCIPCRHRRPYRRSSGLQPAVSLPAKDRALALVYAAQMKYAPQEMRIYSVTAVTAGRRRLFQVSSNADLLIDTIRDYRSQGKFEIHSFVVMPDHFHLLLTPAPTVPLEKVVQLVKGGFSFRLKSKVDVWNRGYFDRRIEDSASFDSCKEYIEQNPVRAKIVVDAKDYAYTSLVNLDIIDGKPQWFGSESQG